MQDAASLTAVRAVSASSVQGRKVSFVGTVIYEEPGSLGLESCEGPCLCLWSQLDHLWRAGPGKVGISAHSPQVEEDCVPPEGRLAPTREEGEGRGCGQGRRFAKASAVVGV